MDDIAARRSGFQKKATHSVPPHLREDYLFADTRDTAAACLSGGKFELR